MGRSKKFILVGVLLAVVVAASIGGVALANTSSGNYNQLKASLASDNTTRDTLLSRVAKILGIDQQKVENAFTQARKEMRTEALDTYLNKLVADGKITKEQAAAYKTWLESKPDMSQYQQQLREWQQARPGIPGELKQWQEARPDVPAPGRMGRSGGMGHSGGMGRFNRSNGSGFMRGTAGTGNTSGTL